MANWEIAHHEQFSFWPQCFQKLSAAIATTIFKVFGMTQLGIQHWYPTSKVATSSLVGIYQTVQLVNTPMVIKGKS